MQAVIFCCNHAPLPEQLGREMPFCLLPLAGKALVERAVESAVEAGCKTVSVILSDHPEQVEALLGRGEKWGATIRYALLSDFSGLGNGLRTIRASLDDELLIFLTLTAGHLEMPSAQGEAVFFSYGHEAACTDFFILQKAQLDVPGLEHAERGDEVRAALRAAGVAYRTQEMDHGPVSAADLPGYVRAHGQALSGLGLPTPGLESSPGVRIGHGCAIHPGVRFNAPVLVAEACQIAADVEIGPEVALGKGCVVERGVRIAGSVIMDNTYIGSRLTIENALVRKNLLVKCDTGTVLQLADAFLLGGTEPVRRSNLVNDLLQRALAGLALLLCSPVLALLYASFRLTGRPRFATRPVAGRVRSSDLSGTEEVEELEQHYLAVDSLFWSRIPSLWDVVRGSMNLVGVETISPEQAQDLDEPWQRLRFQEKPGLINPWHGLEPQDWDADEKRVMEGYYTRSRSLKADMGLLWASLHRWLQPS